MPWDEVNSSDTIRAIGLSEASRGPRLGIQEAFQASIDMQRRNNSVWGIAWHLSEIDDEQSAKAKAAGKEYTPLFMQPSGTTIDEMGNEIPSYTGFTSIYKDVAKQIVDGKDSPYGVQIAAHDAHIAKLNAEDPNLKLMSTSEMYAEVKKKAHEAEYRGNLPTTWGTGWGAGLLGTAAGALDPRTDPFNVISAPLATGTTIAGRIAAQGGIQAGAESLGQITGVMENRRLLGLEYQNPAGAIIGAAIGGAGFQALGEGAVALGRRVTTGKWWVDTPKDPAPPPPPPPGVMPAPGAAAPGMAPGIEPALPPRLTTAFQGVFPEPALRSPLGRTRVGVARVEHDLEHVAVALSPWGGPHPWELPVPQVTRLPVGTPPDPSTFRIDVERGSESVDTLMRRYDPDLFNVYDRLVKQKNEIDANIRETNFQASVTSSKETADLMAQIRDLRERMETATPRLEKKYQERIARLEEEVTQKYQAARQTAAPETWQSRSQLMYIDEQMRDMAPALSRARAHAQGKWENFQAQRAEIDYMIENGLPGADNAPVRSPPPRPEPPPVELPAAMDDFIKKTGVHAIPELQTPGGAPRAGEAYVDAVLRVQKEQAPLTKEAQDAMVSTLIRLATKAEPVTPVAGPPIVQFRIDATAIEATLPPVPDGMTRLWRGNRPGEAGSNPSFTNDLPGIALPFAKQYGGGVSYVDVPTADLFKYVQTVGVATDAEFRVTPELAKAAKAVAPAAPAALAKLAEPERISAAAIRVGENVYTGPIHGEAFRAAAEAEGFVNLPTKLDEGFVTTTGRYVTREEAFEIARAADQTTAGTARAAGILDRDITAGEIVMAPPAAPRAVAPAAAAPSPDILAVRVHGRDTTIHLDDDKIIVPGEDGTGERIVSVRQLAQEMEDDKKMLQAVTSCQLT